MKLMINGKEAVIGQEVSTRNEIGILKGWAEPYKPSSTGRVYVKLDGDDHDSSFFPSVIGGEWTGRTDR